MDNLLWLASVREIRLKTGDCDRKTSLNVLDVDTDGLGGGSGMWLCDGAPVVLPDVASRSDRTTLEFDLLGILYLSVQLNSLV
jgi:hypothetical protein